MTPFNPDDWMDVVVLMFLGMCSVAAAGIPAWLGLRKQVGHIRKEVSNDHDTNLRDDIDALAKAVSDGFSAVGRDIGGLREEIRTERLERIEGDRLKLVRGRA